MTSSVVLERPLQRIGSRSGPAGNRRKRIYIFPTATGFSYLLLLVVMLLGAVNYSNNMAYMLTFLLGSLFLVCMLHTYRNLRGLIIRLNPARPVFAGEKAQFPLVFDNRYGAKRYGITVTPWPEKRKLRKRVLNETLALCIDADRLQHSTLAIQSTTRGYLFPGRLRIRSTYPLGLFSAWSWLDSNIHCLVYPKPAGNRQLPDLTDRDTEEQIGERAGTDDFTGFRHYRPGDPIRYIDWKALARGQDVLVKKFSGSGARQLILHWQLTARLAGTEARLSQLALWLLEAETGGLYYALFMPESETGIDHGEKHLHHCLEILATHGLDKPDP